MTKQFIADDCLITPDIQRLLKKKRQALGVTFRVLGDYFHVSWSTFRKWETAPPGQPSRCRRFYLDMLNAYLSGEYDAMLCSDHGAVEELLESWRRLPPMVHQCMERITSTYELCRQRPELQRFLVSAVDGASRDALKELVSGGA